MKHGLLMVTPMGKSKIVQALLSRSFNCTLQAILSRSLYPSISHKFLFRTHVTGTIAAIHNDFGVVGVVRSGKMNILVAKVSESSSVVTNIFGFFDLFSHYLSVTSLLGF